MSCCTKCSGRFGPSVFEDVSVLVCRHCTVREELTREIRSSNRRIEESNRRIEELSSELHSLREFVALNVGVPPAAAPAITPPPSGPTASEPTNNDVSPPPQNDFQEVRNGVRPKPRAILPITMCENRFQILTDGEEEEEADEVRLVGDSIVRGQLTEFCARAPRSRKRFCIPGGGIDDVTKAIGEVTSLAPTNTTYVVHVGTNDVQRTRSEELMTKYRQMIQALKTNSKNIIISGILPRLGVGSRFANIATSTNRRLQELCREEGIGFVNTWDNFYYDNSLFSEDGVHLNQVGAARFGRLLNDAVRDFRSSHPHPRSV